MLCSVDCLILLPFPLPLVAAALLHHCVGTAYEIIVNQALVLLQLLIMAEDTATFDHGTFLGDIRMEVCGHIFA